MAQAATNSLDLAQRIAQATAQELRFAGINWVFSPVCDVNSDPRNPVIGASYKNMRDEKIINNCAYLKRSPFVWRW
jgi:beta-glucosidase-like glycosyl hydrolase